MRYPFAQLKKCLDAMRRNEKGHEVDKQEEIYTPLGQPMVWGSASHTGGAPYMVTLELINLEWRHCLSSNHP